MLVGERDSSTFGVLAVPAFILESERERRNGSWVLWPSHDMLPVVFGVCRCWNSNQSTVHLGNRPTLPGSQYCDDLFYTEMCSEKRQCKSASVRWTFILSNRVELRVHVPLKPNSETLSPFWFRHLRLDKMWQHGTRITTTRGRCKRLDWGPPAALSSAVRIRMSPLGF